MNQSESRGLAWPSQPAGEGPHILHQCVEGVDAADGRVGLRCRRIARDAVLIQAGVEQGRLPAVIEQDGVGVEQDGARRVGLPGVANHAGQLPIEQRLADAVQHQPLHHRKTRQNRPELVEGQIVQRLQLGESANARRTARVAAIRHFDVQVGRQLRGRRVS